jgi:hypothetical protein
MAGKLITRRLRKESNGMIGHCWDRGAMYAVDRHLYQNVSLAPRGLE